MKTTGEYELVGRGQMITQAEEHDSNRREGKMQTEAERDNTVLSHHSV